MCHDLGDFQWEIEHRAKVSFYVNVEAGNRQDAARIALLTAEKNLKTIHKVDDKPFIAWGVITDSMIF
jgi:hypothetical protein